MLLAASFLLQPRAQALSHTADPPHSHRDLYLQMRWPGVRTGDTLGDASILQQTQLPPSVISHIMRGYTVSSVGKAETLRS